MGPTDVKDFCTPRAFRFRFCGSGLSWVLGCRASNRKLGAMCSRILEQILGVGVRGWGLDGLELKGFRAQGFEVLGLRDRGFRV